MTSPRDRLALKTQEFILQPTTFCNLDCTYCYLPHRSSLKRMQMPTLARIFERIFSSSLVPDCVKLVWHAGEPLTLPLHFYEDATCLIQHYNTHHLPVLWVFQTNGTRITPSWCEFFQAHQAHVSLSLDGPQAIHDAHRVDRAGQGSFARALRGLDLLQQYHIPFSVLMVLTHETLDHPDALWQFLLDHHVPSVAFLVQEALGTCETIPLSTTQDRLRYRTFLQRILFLRETCDHPPFLREIDLLMNRLTSLTHPVWAQANTPLALISFDCEGNISTFSPELLTMNYPPSSPLHFGNVFDNTLEDILTHPRFLAAQTQIQHGVRRCQQTCEYFLVCGGGSPASKLSEHGTFDTTTTTHCTLRIQETTDVVLEYLEQHPDATQG